MVDWKGTIKRIGTVTSKSIITGTKIIANETKNKMQNVHWKNQILNKMYPGVIKKLAHEKGLKPTAIDGSRPSIDDYRRAIVMHVSLDDIIDFARRKGVPIRDITEKIDKDRAEKEMKTMSEGTGLNEMIMSLANEISSFNPLKNYDYELPYQVELAGFLKSKFPNLIIEKQRGSARPDIVIGGIAIEVKGPTADRDLGTIADKCLRYSKYFKQGIIVVLFNTNVNSYRYKDWLEGLKKTHPQVIVIKK
ncbi:MAG: hypothetical protein NTU57_05120 [Candidatus Aenigmarchaeota archaeon]|nr:hypothetical protein [Candidatus Aenigmarchaeota archaeon]